MRGYRFQLEVIPTDTNEDRDAVESATITLIIPAADEAAAIQEAEDYLRASGWRCTTEEKLRSPEAEAETRSSSASVLMMHFTLKLKPGFEDDPRFRETDGEYLE